MNMAKIDNENKDIMDSEFISKYVNEMTEAIKRMNPSWKKKEIEEIVIQMVSKNFQNPSLIMDNNYTHQNQDASLLSVIDWWYKRQCILAGNGTFYKNQHEALNPIAKMLRNMASKRKALKKQMFAYDESEPEYKQLDLGQRNEKINMNSYYGGSGLPVSAFYSLWSGPATTLTAQSVISTTETAFEGFIADNYLFINLEEFVDWSKAVLEEKWERDKWVPDVDKDKLFNRLRSKFYKWRDEYEEPLYLFVSNLSDDERVHMYYKNNVQEFIIDNPKMKKLFRSIYEKVANPEYVDKKASSEAVSKEEYEQFIKDCPYSKPENFGKDFNKWVNVQRFLDPNEAPETIKEALKELSDYVLKYCYVRYLVPDRVGRLKFFIRRAVVVVDTDSNMLNLGPWSHFVKDNILDGDSFGRSDDYNAFISVNTMAYMITNMVTDLLLYYGEKSNIPEEYRPIFNMKNEFLFKKIIIAKTKKRYLSLMVLREGNLYNPMKVDEKGLDYIKSGTSESAMNFYRGLTVKYLLDTDEIDPKGLFNEIQEFRIRIKDSLRAGSKEYLPNASAKEIAAYADPWKSQNVRAVYAWNCIYPDTQIEVPCKVSLLKLNIFTENDIEPLKNTNPEVYNALMSGIFRSPNEAIRSKGCQVIAIPNNVPEIPEWCRDYIDYSSVVGGILSSFNCVMELVKFKPLKIGKQVGGTSRKTTVYSNIIKF